MIFIQRAARAWKGAVLPIAIGCSLAGMLAAQQQPNPANPTQAPPSATQAPAPATPLPGTLKIVILEGQNGVNNVRTPSAVELAVEVRDLNDRPMDGAKVDFQMPLIGPSGSFEGAVRNKETIANAQGQASVTYTPNNETGPFAVQVRATLGDQTGTITIMQRNSTVNERGPRTGGSWVGRHKKLVILIAAVVVVGGVVGGVLATRGGSSGSGSTTTLTVTPGVPSVGAP
ncbi:MAG: hypothetical protein JO099_00045 [Acidobacteriia bacterium]|nr:hypothetical protein [Terriglobia bacterium]